MSQILLSYSLIVFKLAHLIADVFLQALVSLGFSLFVRISCQSSLFKAWVFKALSDFHPQLSGPVHSEQASLTYNSKGY